MLLFERIERRSHEARYGAGSKTRFSSRADIRIYTLPAGRRSRRMLVTGEPAARMRARAGAKGSLATCM